MSDFCCENHKIAEQDRRSLLLRNLALFLVGVALHFHEIEMFFLYSVYSPVFFVVMSLMLAHVVLKDFNHVSVLNLFKTHMLPKILALYFFGSVFQISYFIPIFLFILHDAKDYLVDLKNKIGDESPFANFESIMKFDWVPSMDLIVLLSAFVTWGSSAMIIFNPLMLRGEILLHDTFLTLGIYNLGRWIRAGWQNHKLLHNHTSTVVLKEADGKTREIALDSLRKNDHIVVKSKHGILVPVSLKAVGGTVTYFHAAGEKIVTMPSAQAPELESYHTVYSGEFICQSDYISNSEPEYIAVKEQNASRGEWGVRLFLLVMYLYAFGMSASVAAASGFVAGVERLCLSLMVACPCVYLVIKPAIQHRISSLSSSLGILMHTTVLPLVHTRQTVVFDRTGTLFHPNPNNLSGAYIISDRCKEMIKNLVAQGIEVKILSGHSTDNWKEHYDATCADLEKLGVKNPQQNVIFDSTLHGENSLKYQYIQKLRKYGSFQEPSSFLTKSRCFIERFMFSRSIIMVGDDLNDMKAMEEADIAITVGKVDDRHGDDYVSYNDHISRYAHFVTSRKGIEQLHQLFPVLRSTSRYVRLLTSFSAGVATFMMASVSGYLPLACTLNPALICAFSSSYCFAITLISHSSILDYFFDLQKSYSSPEPLLQSKPQKLNEHIANNHASLFSNFMSYASFSRIFNRMNSYLSSFSQSMSVSTLLGGDRSFLSSIFLKGRNDAAFKRYDFDQSDRSSSFQPQPPQ